MNRIKSQKLILFLIFFLLISQSIAISSTALHQKLVVDKTESPSNKYSLLVIIPEKYVGSSVNKFSSHKNDLGIKTIIKTTENILDDFKGKDKQEKIKYCIKEAYDDFHISSVLLIGNFKDIPVRYCYNNDEFLSMEPYFISDLYYADLYDEYDFFSSWNTDDDSQYGEWNGNVAEDKNISLTPEVSIGRLPCSNRFEVKTMINKIITYETETDYDEWFHQFVVAGGDTYSEARGYEGDIFNSYEGEQLTDEAIDILSGFEATTLWASTEALSTLSIIKAINDGCGFLYLSGHGSPGVWCTHPPNSAKKVGSLPNQLMPFLRNKNKLPICIVGGCHNSQFDVHPFRIFQDSFMFNTWRSKCWSWKLTSSPHGGAVATIGCTGLGWQGIEFGGGGANWLNIQFFKEYSNGTTTLGTIWKNTITKYLQNFPIDWETPSGKLSSLDAKTVQEWTLIGDPSLQVKV